MEILLDKMLAHVGVRSSKGVSVLFQSAAEDHSGQEKINREADETDRPAREK